MASILINNPHGLQFVLVPNGLNQTDAYCRGSKIILPLSILDVLERWADWTQRSKLVQEAFGILTTDQREFLMTGITPKEVN